MEAVASGLNVSLSPLRSAKVYISFSTISVASPILRAKRAVFSRTGILISLNPNDSNRLAASFSMVCHRRICSGRISLNPRMVCIIMLFVFL
jgi:hypothetical protein